MFTYRTSFKICTSTIIIRPEWNFKWNLLTFRILNEISNDICLLFSFWAKYQMIFASFSNFERNFKWNLLAFVILDKISNDGFATGCNLQKRDKSANPASFRFAKTRKVIYNAPFWTNYQMTFAPVQICSKTQTRTYSKLCTCITIS